LIHLVGLIPAFLVLLGLTRRLRSPRALDWRDGAALTCLAFFMAKTFPIWPAFNEFVGSLPILKQSWFIVYFLPIFVWFVAFYAAEGMERVVDASKGLTRATLAYGVLLLAVVTLLCRDIAHQSYWDLLASGSRLPIQVLSVFLAFALLCLLGGRMRMGPLPDVRRGGLLALMVLELVVMHPGGFHRLDDPGDFWDPKIGDRIALLAARQGKQKFDLRINDPYGEYVSSGIATVDDGGPPILHRRYQLLRTKLFVVPWNGHLPLERARFPYSWDAVSNNLFLGSDSADVARRVGCVGCEAIGEVATNLSLYWNPSALPRAYQPARCLVSSGMGDSVGRLTRPHHFEPGMVFLETIDPEEQRLCEQHRRPSATAVPILEDSGSRLRLAEVKGPTVLVLNDNVYPGWTARDEATGRDLPIRAANLAFRALVLAEPRTYSVRFSYRPSWLPGILTATAIGALGTLFCLARAVRRDQGATG
jgi:hypothetical protein